VNHKSDIVTLIVTFSFSGDLLFLALNSHVWISEKSIDRDLVCEIWNNNKYQEGVGSLTTFTEVADGLPESSVADMLPTIDEHHGVYSQEPPWKTIEVIGARLTREIHEILDGLGVKSVEQTTEGFRAQR